jgi:hypothetical protein
MLSESAAGAVHGQLPTTELLFRMPRRRATPNSRTRSDGLEATLSVRLSQAHCAADAVEMMHT